MAAFRAFRIVNEHDTVRGALVDMTLDELSPGEVVIRAAYSSVNYKDALAGTGTGKILRRFPLVGGIDVSGSVESSSDDRFKPGDQVLVTGYDLGVQHDGGYAAYVRVPADWVVPLPAGLTPFEAMTLGTAGFTAGLGIHRLEQIGLRPASGPVVVTGATGGVGSVAVATLARLGYNVTALTGKATEHGYLRQLGAANVLDRSSVVMGTKPLEKATWAAAIDPVGGETLAWLTRTTNYWGGIASAGLTGGVELRTTVMPFILRGVSILGIDSVLCPMDVRRDVWRRLATDMKPVLSAIAREITLDELPEAFATLLAGRARGRYVVQIA
jgi:acrylyl-CoA reductase (NADPH)